MNSIRRPRSRPRVQSINFRTFEWVLYREAVFAIFSLPGDSERNREFRDWLATTRTHKLREHLALFPLLRSYWRD